MSTNNFNNENFLNYGILCATLMSVFDNTLVLTVLLWKTVEHELYKWCVGGGLACMGMCVMYTTELCLPGTWRLSTLLHFSWSNVLVDLLFKQR